MSDQKIQAWVNDAPSPDLVRIRQAVHTVIATIARTPVLRESMYLKGGILLAIKHQSSRFTSDLDFSNPAPYSHDQIDFGARASFGWWHVD